MSRIDDIRADVADKDSINWLEAHYLLEVIDELSYALRRIASIEAFNGALAFNPEEPLAKELSARANFALTTLERVNR